jgi:ABC-type sugar transport system ATPase subunit
MPGSSFPSSISNETANRLLIARKSLTSTSNLICQTREKTGSFKKISNSVFDSSPLRREIVSGRWSFLSMAGLSLRNIVKRFGKTEVIHGISLDIDDGEFVVFVGPSGCGKSTLLRIIAGLEELTEGEVWIGGENVIGVEPAKRGVAMVFQSYALYPHMSVEENMGFGLRMANRPKQEIRERVNRAAEILRLSAYLKRRPKELSGGQRQRVAIGRAIVREPEVFLFDEPLSNLDAELRVQMRIEISKLHGSLQTTMVYVTHDQVEAMTLAEKIVLINEGKVEQIGRPMDLYQSPVNLFVAGFIGSPKMNFLKVNVAGAERRSVTVESPDFFGGPVVIPTRDECSVAPGTELTLGIRPEHIKIVPKPEANGLLTIEVVESLGDSTLVHGLTAGNNRVTITLRGFNDLRHTDSVGFCFAAKDAHLFDPAGASV